MRGFAVVELEAAAAGATAAAPAAVAKGYDDGEVSAAK